MSTNGHRTSMETWHRFKAAVKSFRASATGKKAMKLFFLLVALLLSMSGLNVLNSYVGRDFISAIEHRDTGAFLHQAWLYLAVFGLSTLAAVMTRYSEESLGLLWREWQTRRLITSYLKDRAFYQLEETGEVENPDQRISEDVRTFTTTTLSFALMTMNAVITVVAFSGVLWSISPRLFIVAVIYAGVGSLLTVWLGHKLVGLNDHQLDKEANFRSELMHVRENAEPLALLHREEALGRRLGDRLNEVVANAWRMVKVNRNLGFFTTGYNYLIQIMPALVVAPMFISGTVEFGVTTQSAMAFAQLMGAFSLIVTQFQSISSYAAVIGRLGRLGDAIDNLCTTSTSPVKMVEDAAQIRFEHLTLKSAEGEMLVKDLNVVIPRGVRTLIRGVSGHAKAALFKAVAGLSCEGEGLIARPAAPAMLFLPERPYLPKSTLRVLLANGSPPEKVTDEKLRAVLKDLNLSSMADQEGGLDTEQDWTALPVNEQALLVVARVLLAAPDFVFLDRMSIALDARQSAQVLQGLTERRITYVMMGKPGDEAASFDAALDIERSGIWKWRTLSDLRRDKAVQEAG